MATLHSAELRPTKIELLSAWVPSQSWSAKVDTAVLESVGAFRFDDPDGEVGVETHLLRAADGQIIQVPLTYRARALEGADDSLITKMHHSVLGERWVYDASVDPVFARTLGATILLGGEQADLIYVGVEPPQKRETTTWVRGSGSLAETVPNVKEVTFTHAGNVTIIDTTVFALRVRRVVNLGHDEVAANEATLRGRWPGRDEWTLLSTLSRTAR